jgi:hypothetical protein
MDFAETSPWAFALIGGPLALVLALAWAKFRIGKRERRIDDGRSADDPAKGM